MPLTAETRYIEVNARTGAEGGRNSSVIVSLTDTEVVDIIASGDSLRVTDGLGNPLAYQVLGFTPGEWAQVIVNLRDSDETNGDTIRFYTNAGFGDADKVALTSFGEYASAKADADEFDPGVTVYTHAAQNAGSNPGELTVANCKNFTHPSVRTARGWTQYKTDAAALAETADFSHTYLDAPLPVSSATTPNVDEAFENPVLFGVTNDVAFAFEEVPGGINPLASWPGGSRANFRSDPSHDLNDADATLYVFDRHKLSGVDTLRRIRVTAGAGGSWQGVTVGADESIGTLGAGELASIFKSPSVKFDASGRLHMFGVGGGSETDDLVWLYSDSQGDAASWNDVGTIEMGGGNPAMGAWHCQVSDLIGGYYYLAYTEGKDGQNLSPNNADVLRRGRIRVLRISKDDLESLRLDGWEECRYITAESQGVTADHFDGGFYTPCVYERGDGRTDVLFSAFAGTTHPDLGPASTWLVGRISDVDLSTNTPTAHRFWGRGWFDAVTTKPAALIFDLTESLSEGLVDRSGNNRDGTLRNDPEGGGAAGASHNAAQGAVLFDGNSVIDVGADSWSRTDEFVLNIQFRVDAIAVAEGTPTAYILAGMTFQNAANPCGLLMAVRDYDSGSGNAGDLMLAYYNASGTSSVLTFNSGPNVADGAFHELTLYRKTNPVDATDSAEDIVVFLDGQRITGGVVNAGSGNIGGAGGAPVFGIGGSFTTRTSSSPWAFLPLGSNGKPGYIRRVEFYTEAPWEYAAGCPRSFDWDTANRADVPNALDASSVSPASESMTVSWELSATGDAATQVDIEHADNPHFVGSTTVVVSAAAGSAEISGLTNGTTYWARVRPKNAGGLFSLWTAPMSAMVSAGAPAVANGAGVGLGLTDRFER